MFAAIGSTQTTAIDSSISGTTLYGATIVSSIAPAVTPSEPLRPCWAMPDPPATSRESVWPW